jgi:hypothetical protein
LPFAAGVSERKSASTKYPVPSPLFTSARAVDAAAREFGFFQIVGHRLPRQCIDSMLAASSDFFAQPTEVKLRCTPADPSINFVAVLVIFVTAALLGFLSHAPGSLGVFEAAMLVALTQFQKEELLASLLIFRVLYFMLPFCAAVLLLSAREGWLAARVSARKACAAAAKDRQLS